MLCSSMRLCFFESDVPASIGNTSQLLYVVRKQRGWVTKLGRPILLVGPMIRPIIGILHHVYMFKSFHRTLGPFKIGIL